MNDTQEESKPTGVSVGNVFSLIFLGLTSLGYAYSPEGFGGANLMNHILALGTVVSGVNLLIKLG